MKKVQKIINILLSTIIIVQPILELIYLNSNQEILGLQISTLLRLILFGVLSIFFIINFKQLKYKKIFIPYLVLVIIYFVLHHINALNFNSYNPNNFNYSLFEELSYILRLLIPLFLIYYVVNSEIKEKHLKISIIISSLLISSIIIISNIFKFSICSYGYGPIEGNIFDWFINPGKYNYLTLASRGLFNHVTIFYLIILTSPYIFYTFLKNNSKKSNILLGLLLLIYLITAFMVGTKATTLGYIIIIIVFIVLDLFFSLIKKEYKINWIKSIYLIILTFIAFLTIPYSPMTSRNNVDSVLQEENISNEEENTDIINNINIDDIKEHLSEDIIKELTINDNKVNINEVLELVKDEDTKKLILVDVIEDQYLYYGMTSKFIEESYSYQYDPFFWKNFVDNTELYERSNNRMVVERIYKRVMDINDNKYDKLLGITYSRTSKMFNLERDFLYQTYSLGVVGTILLLGPYILIIICCGLYMLKNFKKHFNLINCSLMLGIGLTLCLAFYSGNTIDSLAITMPLGIMSGYLIKSIIDKNEKKGVQYVKKNKK